jgi:flagellar basal body-associated protein FliL
MIYIDEKQLNQVEYLIEQSMRGHHVLFDNEIIRKVFSLEINEVKNPNHNEKLEKEIEQHIENLILQPTLLLKRAYLEKLPKDIFVKVVRTYFAIVENNICEQQPQTH